MRFPKELKYTKDHEWTKTDGNVVTVGITDHAQSALGDIVFCELPQVGRTLKAHETFGVVESIKAVSDLYSPLAGKVTASNSDLPNNPSDINHDPYGKAWMIKLEIADTSALKDMMDADAYAKFVETQ